MYYWHIFRNGQYIGELICSRQCLNELLCKRFIYTVDETSQRVNIL